MARHLAADRRLLSGNADVAAPDSPVRRSRETTNRTVLLAIANDRPCAGMIIAVLTPMTSPRDVTSGPPELPGLSAASSAECHPSTGRIARATTAQRTDDARRDRAVEAVRIADSNRNLPHSHRV
jgi:hypothetical protein